MALIFADLVQETTATTGTGTLNLAGAVAQFQSFVSGIGTGNTCYYTLLSGNAADWEIGIGTVTSGSPNTLARTTVLKSSNSNAAISLSGTSSVFCSMPAEYMVNSQFSRYVAKTTTYTAVAGDQILADTSGGAWTLTLPSSPAVNDTIEVIDALQCFDVFNLTISPNGGKIQGITNSLVMVEACSNAVLTYTGSTYGWVASMSSGISTATIWDVNSMALNGANTLIPIAPNGRRLLMTGNTAAHTAARATTYRSAGKVYFEVKLESIVTSGVLVGIGASSTSLSGYLGQLDALTWGYQSSTGSIYNNGSSNSASAGGNIGDTVGIAVDFTASTGSIKFYKNNTLTYTASSLTLGSKCIMLSSAPNGNNQRVLLCTTAQQCAYSPPSGYSYWDA